ncbi:Uncharacterised protein [Enterobacter kobei]|nr:Uncharacterised protein [Enterobacter kobei]
MNLNNLKNALEQIIFELNANGKHESANFFQTRYDQIINFGNDSNLLIVFYVQIMPDDFVMQLHRF